MAIFSNEHFENKTVNVDDNRYQDCTFEMCILVYSGGGLPSLHQCHFAACEWLFDGPARRTVQFMSALYLGGFDEMMEKTWDNIKHPEGQRSISPDLPPSALRNPQP